MNMIHEKIITKANFLLSLAQPASFKNSDEEKFNLEEADFPTLGKKPSYVAITDEENEKNWQQKVSAWRSDL